MGGIRIGTSKRNGLHNSIDGPGPGNYSQGNLLGGPNYGFGTGSRGKGHTDDTPGPGYYKVPYYIANLPRYAMPDRKEEFKYR